MITHIYYLFKSLIVEIGNATLPSAGGKSVAVYDGGDSVFIVGGQNYRSEISQQFTNQVVKYSLSTDTVEVVGR